MSDDLRDRIDEALIVAADYGQYDGAHHKTWVIDQMIRALTGEDYPEWVSEYDYWDEGTPP